MFSRSICKLLSVSCQRSTSSSKAHQTSAVNWAITPCNRLLNRGIIRPCIADSVFITHQFACGDVNTSFTAAASEIVLGFFCEFSWKNQREGHFAWSRIKTNFIWLMKHALLTGKICHSWFVILEQFFTT